MRVGWADITAEINKKEGLNLKEATVRKRYWRGDELVSKYHSRKLRQVRAKQRKRLKVVRENGGLRAEVLAERGKVIENSNGCGDEK